MATQGKVVGPATLQEVKGKGVCLRFPGNTATVSVCCHLTMVRRLSAASAATLPPPAPHTRDAAHRTRRGRQNSQQIPKKKHSISSPTLNIDGSTPAA